MKVLALVCGASVLSILSGPASSHDLGNVPCGIGSVSTSITYSFDTFETSDATVLALRDGTVYAGIEMSVVGAEVEFSKSFNVKYEKTGTSLVAQGIWAIEDIGKDNLAKIGPFAKISCSITGIGEAP